MTGPNVLAKYYPIWRANCLESARWLRSGDEYELRCKELKLPILDPEEREQMAKEYDRRAANYTEA